MAVASGERPVGAEVALPLGGVEVGERVRAGGCFQGGGHAPALGGGGGFVGDRDLDGDGDAGREVARGVGRPFEVAVAQEGLVGGGHDKEVYHGQGGNASAWGILGVGFCAAVRSDVYPASS